MIERENEIKFSISQTFIYNYCPAVLTTWHSNRGLCTGNTIVAWLNYSYPTNHFVLICHNNQLKSLLSHSLSSKRF